MHGQFTWYELTTPDVGAATRFYPTLSGWGTQTFDGDYMLFTNRDVPVAGIFRLSDEMAGHGVPPNWMPYVESSNVDDTVARAVSLGARTLHGPAEIPGTGRFAVVQDPQGAVFGVYRSAHASGAWDGTAAVGRFSWHELMTTDRRAAFEFYRDLFGWDAITESDMGDGLMYAMFGKGSAMYGGMYDKLPGMEQLPSCWLVYLCVKDVGEGVERATGAGATVVRPQMDIPDGSIAVLNDPQGAAFALHHLNPIRSSATPPARAAKKATGLKAASKGAKATPKGKARAATGSGATKAKKAAKKVTASSRPAGRKAAKSAARNRPRKAAKPSARRAAKPTARKGAKPTARKAAKLTARKGTKLTARKATKPALHRTTKRPARPTTRAATRKSAQRVAGHSTRSLRRGRARKR
ncbi:MAG: VOC family protein [Gemmatimonadaceae bacterium]|nr:VOC family protein [Gemmatimonadaceae bacterium]